MTGQIKSQIFSGIKWNTLGQIVRQSFSLIVSIILARLLEPEEFGLVAMLIIFSELANAFIGSGLSASLIQKKKISDTECSTIFFFSIVVASFLYILFFFGSSYIAAFYRNNNLEVLIKVYALGFLIRSFEIVPNALFTRQLDYKKINVIQTVSSISSGVIAILMAYLGYGPYSLVGQAIALSMVSVIMSHLLCDWQPKLIFNVSRFKEMYSFGVRIFFVSLLDKIFNSIDNVIIGKLFGAGALGFYNRGKSTKDIPVRNFVNIATSIVFPIFSRIETTQELRQIFNRYLGLISYLICPVMLILLTTSDSVIYILFSEKWIPASSYLKLFCLLGITIPLNNIMAYTIMSRGDHKKYLKVELVKKAIVLTGMVLGLFFDIYIFLLILVITNYVGLMIIANALTKYLENRLFDIMRIVLPSLLLSIIATIPVYILGEMSIWTSLYVKLIVQVALGICGYVFLSVLFGVNQLKYLSQEFRRRLG